MGREGPGYISPSVQRDAIQRWADYRGHTIAEWHVDEDESGGTQNRPGLRTAIQRVQTGETEGIACWRLNRFARNIAGAITDVERVKAAGGQLAFIEEDIDPAGPFGSFLLTVLLAVATLERDNLVSGWQTAKARAVDRGAMIGPTPYGYQRCADGTLEPGADATHVRRAYELAGGDITNAVHYLRKHAPDRQWTTFTVRRLLASRTYLGEVRNGQNVNPSAHTPIVNVGQYVTAQSTPTRRRNAPADYPLTGIAACQTCGTHMVGGSAGKNVRTYRCAATLSMYKGTRCPQGAHITANLLEQRVRDLMRPLLDGWAYQQVASRDVQGAEQAVRDARSELDQFAADLTMRRALADGYHQMLQLRVDALADAEQALAGIAGEANLAGIIDAAPLIDTADGLRTLCSGTLHRILVMPGRGNVAGRVTLEAHRPDGGTVMLR